MALIFNTSCSANTQTKKGYFPCQARKKVRISWKELCFPILTILELFTWWSRYLCYRWPCWLWYRCSTVVLAWQEPKARPRCASTPCGCVSLLAPTWASPCHGQLSREHWRVTLGNLPCSAGLKAENWLEDESNLNIKRCGALIWKCSFHPALQPKAQVNLATDTVNFCSELALQDCSGALPSKYVLITFPSADTNVCVKTLTELKHMHRGVGIMGKKTLNICSLWFIPGELRYTDRALKNHIYKYEHGSGNQEMKRINKHIPFSPNENCGFRKKHNRRALVVSACPAKTGTSNFVFITVFLKCSIDSLLPNLIWTEYTSC